MDFTQLAGNYLSNRISNRANQAIEPFADPMAYLDQRMDANVAPVQTTQINPAEAAQQDFVPGGELAIERPGVPVSQYLAQARQMSVPGQRQPNMNVPVQQPVQPEPELPPQAFPDPNAQAITSNYAPPGQNQGGYAASQQMAAPNAVVNQQQPAQQAAVPSMPIDGEAAAMSAAPNVYEEFQKRDAYNRNFSLGQNDLKTVSTIAFDDAAPGAVRFAANDKLRTAINNQAEIKAKTAEIDTALADPSGKGAMKMLNAIAREREDGSLLKAIFYQRMGLNDLAKAEQMKLGSMDSYQPVALGDGRQGYVKVNYQGAPVAGWTDAGEMTPDELINAQVGTKGSDVGKQPYKHRTTGELYFLRTTQNGRAQMVNTKGQVYTGDTNQLYAYGIGSDLQIAKEKKLQDYAIDMANAPTLEGRKAYAKELMDYAAKNDDGTGEFRRAAQAKINAAGFDIQDGQVVGTGRAGTISKEQPAPGATTTEQQVAPVAPGTTTNVPSKPVVKDTSIDTMRVDSQVQKERDQGRLATLNKERADLERDLAAEKNPASRKEIQKLLDGNAREIAGTVKNISAADKQANVQQVSNRSAAASPSGAGFQARTYVPLPSQPGVGSAEMARREAANKQAFDAAEKARYDVYLKNVEREQAVRQQREMIPGEVNQVEQTKFIDTGKEVKKQADDAQVVAGARKRQLSLIKNDPRVVGLMYGNGGTYDNARAYVLRLLNGDFDDPIKNKEKMEALAAISDAGLRDTVSQIEGDSQLINTKTVRDTAPVGPITDYEQNMNNSLNMGQVIKGHPMAIANKFSQHQFVSNLTMNKNKFLNDGALAGRFKTDREFNQAWEKEESRLLKEYEGIYEARMRMLKPYEDALRKDPANTKLIDDRKRAIVRSLEVYGSPEYDVSTNSWRYSSAAARQAAKKRAIENVLKGK